MLQAPTRALNADDFGDGKSLADTGLDKPEATVTIALKDGAGKYELLVGKTATGANRWAKRADDDAIFQITNYSAEWATSDAVEVRRRRPTRAPRPTRRQRSSFAAPRRR